jgi:hypothetical protein
MLDKFLRSSNHKGNNQPQEQYDQYAAKHYPLTQTFTSTARASLPTKIEQA